jgi:hypothetical protein
MRQPVCELPVVREQQRAGGVCVESSDRYDARLGGHQADDGGAALRVASSRDHGLRLVQQEVREALRGHVATIDAHLVAA